MRSSIRKRCSPSPSRTTLRRSFEAYAGGSGSPDAAAGVATVQKAMLEKGFIVGRAFPPYNDWCRVSIGTPDEMKAFVAVLPEALRA